VIDSIEDVQGQREEDSLGYYRSILALQTIGSRDGDDRMNFNSNQMVAPKPVIVLQMLDPKINQIMEQGITQANNHIDHDIAKSSSY